METIIAQSRLPDETIIVDGGSSDGTLEILEGYATSGRITLISAPSSNIAQARNIAITASSSDVIACTDGGCYPEVDWFDRITAPLIVEPDLDVVSGVYIPWTDSDFEEIASNLICPDINRLRAETFLPSSRSIAFRKSAWNTVGGYPENLDTAEDTMFDLNLKRAGMKFIIAKDARVYWRIRSDLRRVFKQYYLYSRGNGLASLFPTHYAARLAGVALIVGLFDYGFTNPISWIVGFSAILVLATAIYLRKVRHPSFYSIMVAFELAMTIETASLAGYVRGLVSMLAQRSHLLSRNSVKRDMASGG